MTQPLNPNRIGGVRGPNGATLETVVQVLSQIRDRLDQSDIRLTNIEAHTLQTANDLRRLVGEGAFPSSFTNLPSNLGSASQFRTFLAQYLQSAFGYSITQIPGQSFSSQLNAIQNALASQTNPSTNAISRLLQLEAISGQQVGLLVRIADALKQQGELPADSSIFRLLASIDTNVAQIEECTCGGTNPPNQYPPPDATCSGDVVPWQSCTLEFNVTTTGANPIDIYSVRFPASATLRPEIGNRRNVFQDSIPPGWIANILTDIEVPPLKTFSFEACIAWNLNPSVLPVSWAVSSNTSFQAPNASTGPLPQGWTPQGTQLLTIPSVSAGAFSNGAQWLVGYPQGVTPEGAFYVAVPAAQPS